MVSCYLSSILEIIVLYSPNETLVVKHCAERNGSLNTTQVA